MYPQRKKEWKTILGRVSCDPQEDKTRNGWRLLSFTVDDGKKEWPCKFIQDPMNEDGQSLLEKKEKEGFCRDVTATFKGSWSGDELIVNQMFGIHVKGKKETSNPGGVKASTEEWKKIKADREAKGFVYCKDDAGIYFWHPGTDAVLVNGTYRRSIDWIMDILGGEFVTKFLRSQNLSVTATLTDPYSFKRAKAELFDRARAEEMLRG